MGGGSVTVFVTSTSKAVLIVVLIGGDDKLDNLNGARLSLSGRTIWVFLGVFNGRGNLDGRGVATIEGCIEVAKIGSWGGFIVIFVINIEAGRKSGRSTIVRRNWRAVYGTHGFVDRWGVGEIFTKLGSLAK